jgi:hypothetical protein
MRTATIFGGAAIFSACASLFEAMPAPPTGAQLGTAALAGARARLSAGVEQHARAVRPCPRAGEPRVDHHAVRDRRDGVVRVALCRRDARPARMGRRRVHRAGVGVVELGAPDQARCRSIGAAGREADALDDE